ncbi:MAG: DUF6219 family protein [Anaerobutyricum soehngenii]
MKAHKYWSLGALAAMIGTFYTGYKNMKTAHKYFACSSLGGRVPTKDISPPYVNSETTFPYKKRTFDFSKALIYQHSYLIYYLLKA